MKDRTPHRDRSHRYNAGDVLKKIEDGLGSLWLSEHCSLTWTLESYLSKYFEVYCFDYVEVIR